MERVDVVREGEHYSFELHAVDTHGTDAGFTLRVTPLHGVEYKADMRDVRSGADSAGK